MLRGFYTAASGMIAQQRRTEMLTNNMANVNTPGYKQDQSSLRAFPEMLMQRMDTSGSAGKAGLNLPGSSYLGGVNTGVYVQETTPLFTQGDLQGTEKNTDLALEDRAMPVNQSTGTTGSVFFTVSNDDGNRRYTRNGNFTIDQQGYLTTPSGHYVLNTEGSRIKLDNDAFTVNSNGEVFENDRRISQIGVAYADNPNALVKEGNGLFKAGNGQALPSALGNANVQFSVHQGYVERSNVDSSRSMTDMMTAYRAFEANQKVLQAYDRSTDKMVNEVGRV
ncbi:flagellar hook-basal body protein [Bacillus sp. 1P06AnD]|uniref:flagellar hook-basal body protein n=1 Tax=Bacillus sp. 1P06AnD TaxID=3132208 RepID=UPI0039A0D8DC